MTGEEWLSERQRRFPKLRWRDEPDLIYIVRTLPLGIGDVYAFEEDAQADAHDRRAKGQRAYVVPRRITERRPR